MLATLWIRTKIKLESTGRVRHEYRGGHLRRKLEKTNTGKHVDILKMKTG